MSDADESTHLNTAIHFNVGYPADTVNKYPLSDDIVAPAKCDWLQNTVLRIGAKLIRITPLLRNKAKASHEQRKRLCVGCPYARPSIKQPVFQRPPAT